jgi:quinol monooxygenase YgiN
MTAFRFALNSERISIGGRSTMTRLRVVWAVAVSALLAAVGTLPATLAHGAQDEESPIVALVRKSVSDPAKPFVLLVHLKVKEGQGSSVEAAFAPAIKITRKEAGCLAYDLSRDTTDPNGYMVYERWKSLADLKSHLAAPHIRTLLEAIGTATDGPPKADVFVPVAE